MTFETWRQKVIKKGSPKVFISGADGYVVLKTLQIPLVTRSKERPVESGHCGPIVQEAPEVCGSLVADDILLKVAAA